MYYRARNNPWGCCMSRVAQSADPRFAAHERYTRGAMGGQRAKLTYEFINQLVLTRRHLDEIEFIGCDLPRAQFLYSSLRAASFYCSNIRGADLRGTDLRRADMRGAILRGADLYRAVLDGADFRSACLARADRDPKLAKPGLDFDDENDLRGGAVDFRNCSMVGVRLGRAKLKGADFSGAILDKADLAGADIREAKLDGAVLTNVDLEGVSLDGVSMAGVVRDPDEAAIRRATALIDRIRKSDDYTHSMGKSGKEGKFDQEDLRPLGGALKEKGLAGASFRQACAVGVDFSGAILIGAVFDGADLRRANFEGADLRGCSFKNCNLNHSNFSNAELSSLDGRSGRRFPPAFAGAQLDAARFDDVVIDEDKTLNELLGVRDDMGAG